MMTEVPHQDSTEVLIPGMLAHRVREQILAYLATTYHIRDPKFRQELEDFLISDEGIFKGPFIDIKLPFRAAAPDTSLPIQVTGSFLPYAHQLKAWQRLTTRDQSPKSTIVATGTGSGKTECFLYPILDHVMERRRTAGVMAIIFYPMNALAFDQARRIAKEIALDPRLSGVRAGLIAGEDPDATEVRKGSKVMSVTGIIDDREELIKNPPHILLTNYKMLDVMLQSPDFVPLWQRMAGQSGNGKLRYLVFDEMHTYDGAQGADVALLVRRLKARLGIAAGELTCVGTSATLSSSQDGQTKLLTFARRLSGEDFDGDSIITEDRLSVEEVFAGLASRSKMIPDDSGQLDHRLGERVTDLVARLQKQWFNDVVGDPVKLGTTLMSHLLMRAILTGLAGVPRYEKDLLSRLSDAGFALTSRQLHSFLAMLAQARRTIMSSDGKGQTLQLPLFHVRVQLWMRELTSILARLGGPGPSLVWNVAHRAPRQLQGIYLPPVFCEECGLSGYLAKESKAGALLETRDLRGIQNARLERAASTRYLFPWSGEAPEIAPGNGLSQIVFTCTGCGTEPISEGSTCRNCGREMSRSLVFHALTQPRDNKPQKDRRQCPSCQVDGSLRSLSARMNTLTSIASSEVFLSRLSPPAGKRLLVFADSVQDASHRAGYLNARTYRFSIRTAIQTVLKQETSGDMPMMQASAVIDAYWRDRMGVDGAVAMLTPLDLMGTEQFEAYWRGSRQGHEIHLKQRLLWEVYLEYCLRGQVGRTLEKTLSSMVYRDSSDEEECLKKSFEIVVNRMGRGELQDVGFSAYRAIWQGLVRRMLHKGAVALPDIFDKYRKEGSRYHLSKRKIPWIGPLPSGRVSEGMEVGQLPNFPSTSRHHPIFDFVGASPQGRSWYQDWLEKNIKPTRSMSADDATECIQAIFAALAEVGLLVACDETRNRGVNYALDPHHLKLGCELVLLKCDVCRDVVHVVRSRSDSLVGSPCRVMRCQGTYRMEAIDGSTSFYRNLYSQGQISRIFASEHTGVLGRVEREEIETTFKANDTKRRPFDVNLLSCTSTLEMGIDIGDLGATIAAGLPKTASNYQQRIGRAGRTTGSAFIAAIAQSRPRDLLYYEEPTELVAGHIEPPGCYLDAPDILRRQFAAFLFETYGKELRGERKKLTIGSVVDDLQSVKKSGFWVTLNRLFNLEVEEIFQRFQAACHGGDIPESTWKKVKDEWLTPVSQSGQCRLYDNLVKRFTDFAKQKEDLERESREIKVRVRDLEANPNRDDEQNQVLDDARRYAATIYADLEAIGARGEGLHGFLVRKGFLPNYAFGDDDVELVTYRKLRQPKDGQTFEQLRFVRSAATAIRDFAPGNVYYGGGQRVQVNTLDLGKDSKRHVEEWRFCPECGQLGSDRGDQAGKLCPSCGGSSWGDAGSRTHMVKLKRVKSVIGTDAIAADESETRQTEPYKTRKFFDGRSGVIWGVNDETLTMGIEFVPQMVMREVNFGFADLRFQQRLTITGEELPSGFAVCHACGRLSDPIGKTAHTQTCPRNQATPKVQGRQIGSQTQSTGTRADPLLLLYRQLESEAVRIYVPVRAFNSAEKMASYQAALLLGLRAHFGGLPAHLVVEREQAISLDDRLPQYALVIFDSVPGGSGFMKSLTTKDSFFELVQKALAVLNTCSCAADPAKDGCIRCVYGVVPQRDIPIVSRRCAVDFLTKALDRKDDFTTISSADIRQQKCTESELEDMLADIFDQCGTNESLKEILGKLDIEVRQATKPLATERVGILVLRDKKTGDEVSWKIELQRTIRERSEGLHTRPDFLLTKVGAGSENVCPIAVYCDGFAYHAGPNSGDRLKDDFEKRSALSLGQAGQSMRVWNLDWDTVKSFRDGEQPFDTHWFGFPEGSVDGKFKLDALSMLLCALVRGVEKPNGGLNCPELNIELDSLLRANPSAKHFRIENVPSTCLAQLQVAGFTDQQGAGKGIGNQTTGHISAILIGNGSNNPRYGVLGWEAAGSDRTNPVYHATWRNFLMTHNILGLLTRGVAANVVQ